MEFSSNLYSGKDAFECHSLYLSAQLYHSMNGQDKSTKRLRLGAAFKP